MNSQPFGSVTSNENIGGYGSGIMQINRMTDFASIFAKTVVVDVKPAEKPQTTHGGNTNESTSAPKLFQ